MWRGFWFSPMVLGLNLTGARKEGSSRRSGTLSQIHPRNHQDIGNISGSGGGQQIMPRVSM
jgi:hypothetical protein